MAFYSVLTPKTESEGYGIRVVTERLVRDISYNYSAVKGFCDTCNNMVVDPSHFDDILEEFLSRRDV